MARAGTVKQEVGGDSDAALRLPAYKQVPLLLKPTKRSPAEALPSALHLSAAVTLSMLAFAAINVAVTLTHGPRNPWTKLVQSGCMMGMITAAILATPTLGTSFTKAVARILGVFVGGWLFFGLYAANQSWWFLTLCLTVWAFVLVASSFLLTGQQYLSPVALVTAFVVACTFNSVQQALVMTTVKTVAISGSIVLYTALSMLLFPKSATQQMLHHLAIALDKLHRLAEMILITGQEQLGQQAEGDGNAAAAAPDQPVAGNDEAAAAKEDSSSSEEGSKQSRAAAASAAVAATNSPAAGLAADISSRLQLVQELLPGSLKERYVGSCGSYRCFFPSVRRISSAQEAEVLATVLSASQVLRVLISVMSEFGAAPLSRRTAPPQLGPGAQELLAPLAQHAVGALQDISAAMPVTGSPKGPQVPVAHLHDYSDVLQQLLTATVGPKAPSAAGAAAAATPAAATPAAATPAAPAAAAGAGARWRQAAAAAGARVPQHGDGSRAQQLAAAFGALLSDAVTSDQAKTARWCSTLVLGRQLGRAIAGLNDSVSELLPQLPWVHAAGAAAGAAAAAAAK